MAFDFAGYGRSDRRDGAHFSPEDHDAEITAVLDALGIDHAVLVGHDASGPDALAYSLASPRRVARLVLLNTVFGNQPSLKLPEMTQLFADPQLKTLADDLTGDPNQLLWLLQRWGVQWDLDANDPTGSSATPSCPSSTVTITNPTPSRPSVPGPPGCTTLWTSGTPWSAAEP